MKMTSQPIKPPVIKPEIIKSRWNALTCVSLAGPMIAGLMLAIAISFPAFEQWNVLLGAAALFFVWPVALVVSIIGVFNKRYGTFWFAPPFALFAPLVIPLVFSIAFRTKAADVRDQIGRSLTNFAYEYGSQGPSELPKGSGDVYERPIPERVSSPELLDRIKAYPLGDLQVGKVIWSNDEDCCIIREFSIGGSVKLHRIILSTPNIVQGVVARGDEKNTMIYRSKKEWVLMTGSTEVTILDPKTLEKVDSVLLRGVTNISVSPYSNLVVGSLDEGNRAIVVDLPSRRQVQYIRAGKLPGFDPYSRYDIFSMSVFSTDGQYYINPVNMPVVFDVEEDRLKWKGKTGDLPKEIYTKLFGQKHLEPTRSNNQEPFKHGLGKSMTYKARDGYKEIEWNSPHPGQPRFQVELITISPSGNYAVVQRNDRKVFLLVYDKGNN